MNPFIEDSPSPPRVSFARVGGSNGDAVVEMDLHPNPLLLDICGGGVGGTGTGASGGPLEQTNNTEPGGGEQGLGGQSSSPPPGDDDDMTFCVGQFKNCTGFSMKYFDDPCAPGIHARPLGRTCGLNVPVGGIFQGKSERSICYCCSCCTCGTANARGWQTIRFYKNEMEMFNIVYKPRMWWFAKRGRTAHIYVPERNNRIGWIQMDYGFSNGTTIMDCVNNQEYKTRRSANDMTSSIEIVDRSDKVVAVVFPTRSVDDNKAWSQFELSFSTDAVRGSSYSKVLIFSAVAIWAVKKQEKFFKAFLVTLFILIMFAIWIFAPK